MQFKVISAVTLALATTSQAIFTPDGIANVFEELTDTASDIIQIAATLNPVTIIFSIPKIVDDLANIGASIIEAETGIKGLKETDFNPDEQNRVCFAAENFIDKARDAIDAIIGPKSILGNTPFVTFAAQVLGTAVDGIELFLRNLLRLVPGCEKRIEAKITAFKKSADAGFIRFDIHPKPFDDRPIR